MTAPALTDDSPTDWDGYRTHTIARSTGTLVVLVEAERQGISIVDGGKWALICDEHGGLLQDDTQSVLRRHLAHPESWCPGCQS